MILVAWCGTGCTVQLSRLYCEMNEEIYDLLSEILQAAAKSAVMTVSSAADRALAAAAVTNEAKKLVRIADPVHGRCPVPQHFYYTIVTPLGYHHAQMLSRSGWRHAEMLCRQCGVVLGTALPCRRKFL